MPAPLEPRKLIGYAIVAILVAIMAVQYVRAVGPATEQERRSACVALRPTPFNSALGKLPTPAPALAAQDYTGKMVDLGAYRGRVTLVSFWAPWCPPCVEELPALERLQGRLGGEPFTVLALASMPAWPKVRDFFPKGTNLTVLLDPPPGGAEGTSGALAARFGTDQLPEAYLIDKQGNIRYYFVNKRDWDSQAAMQCMRSLIEE